MRRLERYYGEPLKVVPKDVADITSET